jgi:hypothetical protein
MAIRHLAQFAEEDIVPDFFKVRVSVELWDTFMARDIDGNRTRIDWGESDEEGFYTPKFTVNYDDNIRNELLQKWVDLHWRRELISHEAWIEAVPWKVAMVTAEDGCGLCKKVINDAW